MADAELVKLNWGSSIMKLPQFLWTKMSAVVLAMALAACAQVPEDPEQRAAYDEANDPVEPFNRYVFEVNFLLDELIGKPLGGWYRTALPDVAQDSVRGVLRNLQTPVILANDLFQGESDRAWDTFSRFVINSTVGVAGVWDAAAYFGIPYHDEDFGQTLAVWGTGEGPYMVLPLIGPSNPRDAFGLLVDAALDPLTYILPIYNVEYLSYIRGGASAADTRGRNLEALDEIRRGSLDYYATLRSLYRQSRNDAIRNGEAPDSSLFTSVIDEIDETDATTTEAR